MRSLSFVTLAAALSVGHAMPAPAQAAGCAVVLPTPMRGMPATWLGQCAAGKATGVGVLRAGARAPFAFFYGRVTAGKPQTGLLLRPDRSYTDVRGLTPTGDVLPADGEHIAEQDRAWADAAAGARLVARKFAAAGNAGSAAYYNHEAHRIETERPE